MAKQGSALGTVIVAGVLVFSVSQCLKMPDRASPSATSFASTPRSAPSVQKSIAVAPRSTPAPTPSEVRYVTASSLNVRENPNASASILGRIAQSEEISVLDRNNGWLLVQSRSAGRGWVSEQFTSTSRPTPVYRPPAPIAPIYTPPPQTSGRYIRGPRGGCYYINRNGNKTYVDRSLCR